jgi:predicted nucleic acid-binding protein
VSWLLDADVLCQPAKSRGNSRVIAWLEQNSAECYTSSIVIAQLAFWVRSKRGKQRLLLQEWLSALLDSMHGRVLGFNVSVAHVWAEQQAQWLAVGKPMPIEDSYIAAIARRHGLTVVTGNVRDFRRPGVKLFDPFKESDL